MESELGTTKSTQISPSKPAGTARRMFKALKSLVKFQAVVRGVSVRRQAQIAFHCMHALARLQVTVRARQLQ
ncbi:hypothetical protein RND71_020411 [Anisodus tanguticus]|uniref:Uncharacterized protein n=1 Tax=Anisodus tanguticus TaxID=243964 RepID=A0AAE1S239_9SOLA|nr:hypothetical protein RND71_020411 [Anisodus tanguticus]